METISKNGIIRILVKKLKSSNLLFIIIPVNTTIIKINKLKKTGLLRTFQSELFTKKGKVIIKMAKIILGTACMCSVNGITENSRAYKYEYNLFLFNAITYMLYVL